MPCLGTSDISLMLICCSPPLTELLKTVMRLFNDFSRVYPHADRNMTENLIFRLKVAVDSVHRLVDSLDSGAQVNAERTLPLELLVRQIQYLLHQWGKFPVRENSCTSGRPTRLIANCVGYQILTEECIAQPMKFQYLSRVVLKEKE